MEMYLKFWYGTRSGDWWVRAGRAAFHARNERQEVRIMLVITRREGEEVVIGDPANPLGVVRIASIKGDRVRIALDFPRDVPVHRREVAAKIVLEGPSIAGKIRPASNDS